MASAEGRTHRRSMARYRVISADCHAGLPALMYRTCLEGKYEEGCSREHAEGWGKLVYGEA